MIQFIIIFLFSNILLSDDSYNMQLLGYLPYNQSCSDITGFYQDGREFAVIGLQNAASFVDITDPYNPFEVGRIDGSNSIWRDLKYWNRHIYIGTEAADGYHGRRPVRLAGGRYRFLPRPGNRAWTDIG